LDNKLDSGAIFYLDRSVPVDDQVTSLTGVGGSAYDGPVPFTTTQLAELFASQKGPLS
jgi:hypothetical protein